MPSRTTTQTAPLAIKNSLEDPKQRSRYDEHTLAWPLGCEEPNFKDVMGYDVKDGQGKGKGEKRAKQNTSKVAEAGRNYRIRNWMG